MYLEYLKRQNGRPVAATGWVGFAQIYIFESNELTLKLLKLKERRKEIKKKKSEKLKRILVSAVRKNYASETTSGQ